MEGVMMTNFIELLNETYWDSCLIHEHTEIQKFSKAKIEFTKTMLFLDSYNRIYKKNPEIFTFMMEVLSSSLIKAIYRFIAPKLEERKLLEKTEVRHKFQNTQQKSTFYFNSKIGQYELSINFESITSISMYFGSHVFDDIILLDRQIHFLLYQFSDAAASHYEDDRNIIKDNKEEL
ncbi:hypothetical protein P5808_22125 [Bacillus cereus]|jgi:hypothetical protein|nr:hypothetical protein [Bacillus cereus]MED2841398.1 hypothetical protein [Bacillus wiedmannii]MDF9506919.1 hypothetical protein [Bacillus cereus]MDF9596690.1 hypothetical protein [Bacillus cereus]MDF9609372.1 hypothetical protein [Bacillus cereus]MDF9659942.1 hypothetical protein [Bacillus cereus]